MARIEDYLKTDELDNEIEDAATKTEERASTMPERFQGKSAEEIANSYVELEKMNSRQAQDLGEMRKQVDELIRQSEESRAATEKEAEAADPVTVDDLYDNTEEAIAKVVERVMRPHQEAQEQLTQQQYIQQGVNKLDAEYEGWQDLVKTDEFQKWVHGTPYRSRMAEAVDKRMDFDAANDLLAQYYDLNKQAKDTQAEARREENLRSAQLETGGAEYSEPAETFSRTELMNMRIRAKRGDREATDWLNARREAIAFAYEDGRIVD